MKRHLVIGLGNPLMGDEGIAFHLLQALRGDPRLPEDVELFWGGGDLLGCADRMAGRSRVTVLDAMLDPSEPGALRVLAEDDFATLETRHSSAHQLSAAGAVELLRRTEPAFRGIRFKLMVVTISAAELQLTLSPLLGAKMPHLLDQVVMELR